MARLFVVATPIGNLNDLTPRMREALACADLIAAEDTRVTMKLLNRMELKKPLVSCHRHNEDARAPQLIERMLAAVSYTHLDVYKRQGRALTTSPRTSPARATARSRTPWPTR